MEIETKMDDIKFDAFTDEEIESLRLFHEQVGKMKECKVIKDKALKVNVSIENTAEGLETTMEASDDDNLGLLLIRIRPCLLQKDRVFFNRILNILGRKAANKETREHFGALYKNYQHFLKSTAIEFRVGGQAYRELDIFNAFLNGDFFHVREEEPRKIATLFREKMPTYMHRTAIISCMIDYLGWFTLVDRIIALQVLAQL